MTSEIGALEKMSNNWDEFVAHCNEQGVSLEHYEDYEYEWICWKAGYDSRNKEYRR